MLTKLSCCAWSSAGPGLSPETVRELAHLAISICLMQQPNQNRQQQPPGGRWAGCPASPLLLSAWAPPGPLTGEDLLGWGGSQSLTRGFSAQGTPAMAPSHGGLCSFCHIWQWNRQCPLAIRRGFLVSGSSLDSILWAHWAHAPGLLHGAHTLTLIFVENTKWERHR